MPKIDVLVVGAGLAGSTMARLLADSGRSVRVIDRRPHVGGNAFDVLDAHGVLVHPYGPHIFHTNSPEVVAFLSRFTAWRPYEHRVLARIGNRLFPMPINRSTLERFFGLTLADDKAAKALLERIRIPHPRRRNSAEVVLDAVGRELYEAFFRGYTRKQWGKDPADLDPSVAARVQVRTSTDDRYFTDTFQQMPGEGYTMLIKRMLEHPDITIETATAYDASRHRNGCRLLVWTGPVDLFFGYRLGRLPYISLRFEHSHYAGKRRYQAAAVINEPDEAVAYTRTTEFTWMTGQEHCGTSVVREYFQREGEPYYPLPAAGAVSLADQYRALADKERDVLFVGRLAQYKYLNMDEVVAEAMRQAAKYPD